MSAEDKGTMSIISDLTNQIEKLRKLNSELEAKYRYVFDGMANSMAVYDTIEDGRDFIFKDFNRAAEVSSKLSREDVIGKSVKEVFPAIMKFGLFEVFQAVFKTGTPQLHPASIYKDNRLSIWVENYVYRLPTGEIVAIYEDLTSQKQAEESLKQRMKELEAINAMSHAVSMNISLDQVVDSALEQLLKTLQPDLLLIYLIEKNETDENQKLDDRKMLLQKIRQSNNILHFPKQSKDVLNIGECLCGIAAQDENSVFALDMNTDKRCTNSECKIAGIQSYASMPLINREQLIGVIGIGSCYKRDFSIQSTFLKSLISIIAVSIANALLQEKAIKQADQLINQAVDNAMHLMEHSERLEETVEQRTSELRKFFNAVEASPASIVITDKDGNIEYANPFFTELTGYTSEEAKGQNPRVLKSGLHSRDFYKQMWETLLSGKIWRGEICNRKKNGEIYWENVAISPLREVRVAKNNDSIQENVAGNIVNFVAVKEDITQRKLAETALKESELRYKTIFDWSQDGIIVADQTSKKFLFSNKSASTMFGYEEDGLVGKSVLDIHPPEHILDVLERFQQQSQGQITYAVELPCMKKDGTLFYCDVNATPVNIDGKPCAMGFFRDVTERKRTQEIREDVERILRHDLKSPINAVIGFPQVMIYDTNLTEMQRKFLNHIKDAGQNMLDMINLSLTIYNIETGRYQYIPSNFNLIKVIRQCIANAETQYASKNITMNLWADKGLDRVYIEDFEYLDFNGDRLLAFSIFSNLIKNAVEASPEFDSINIVIEPESVPVQKSKSIKVIIHNKGVVPADIRNRFFEKYVTSGKEKGTGLGTYSAKLLAKSQGWDIEMKTSEEDGTYLIVTVFA